MNPEEIQRKIDEQLEELSRLQKLKLEAEQPVTVTLTNVMFTGIGGMIEVKLSRHDQPIVDAFRTVPTRYYAPNREVNQFSINYFKSVVSALESIGHKLIIPPEQQAKLDEWFNAPDFVVSIEEKRNQIKVSKTIHQKTLGLQYDIGSWTYHASAGYWTFNKNELLKWAEIQLSLSQQYKFELSPEVQKMLEEMKEREALLDAFATMKDAPDIQFQFGWENGEPHNFELKADQRVACKFDDTFNHRTLLSFDMGKGKTAIAIAQAERHNERVLFVCKADLKTNIRREVRKFTGKESYIYSGIEPDRQDVENMLVKKPQYNIINYNIIGREVKEKKDDKFGIMKWVELINAAKFDRIIFDEAHYMRNPSTQMSRGGRALRSEKVMLLTGTPIVNRPGELWSTLNIIDPDTFADYPSFEKQFTYADRKTPKNLPALHKLLKRYMIRRLRDESTDPNRIPQYHTLSSDARRKYNDVLAGVYTALRNPNYQRNVTNILTELLRCKQICADDKVDFTVDLCETAIEETAEMPWNKVIIFSQFKNTQAELAARIPGSRIINGEVTDKARYEIVDEFQDHSSKVKVLITNIMEGLTLTEAYTVIINDLWWTPKDHSQAEGRAFGRTNDPHGGNAYYILAEESIDEMIWKLLEKKFKTFKSVVDDVYIDAGASDSLIGDLLRQLKESL